MSSESKKGDGAVALDDDDDGPPKPFVKNDANGFGGVDVDDDDEPLTPIRNGLRLDGFVKNDTGFRLCGDF